MEINVKLKIEKITEADGVQYFLATSDDVQGLVAQGSTLDEVIEIAEDLARIMLEIEQEWKNLPQKPNPNLIEHNIVVKI